MAYIDQYALGEDATFQHRVQVGVLTAAVQVQGEAKDGMSDTAYVKRQNLARRVISGTDQYTRAFARMVATNSAITTGSSDSDIQFTVNSMWSDVAGVDLND
jgi:hypothetical protein